LSAAKQCKYVQVATCKEYEGPHQHIETEDNTFCMSVGRWLGDSFEKKADSKRYTDLNTKMQQQTLSGDIENVTMTKKQEAILKAIDRKLVKS
jgi:hypothetical protein